MHHLRVIFNLNSPARWCFKSSYSEVTGSAMPGHVKRFLSLLWHDHHNSPANPPPSSSSLLNSSYRLHGWPVLAGMDCTQRAHVSYREFGPRRFSIPVLYLLYTDIIIFPAPQLCILILSSTLLANPLHLDLKASPINHGVS